MSPASSVARRGGARRLAGRRAIAAWRHGPAALRRLHVVIGAALRPRAALDGPHLRAALVLPHAVGVGHDDPRRRRRRLDGAGLVAPPRPRGHVPAVALPMRQRRRCSPSTTVASAVTFAGAEVPEERLSRAVGALAGPTYEAIADGVGAATGTDGAYQVRWSDAADIGSPGFGLLDELERRGLDVAADEFFARPGHRAPRAPAGPGRRPDPSRHRRLRRSLAPGARRRRGGHLRAAHRRRDRPRRRAARPADRPARASRVSTTSPSWSTPTCSAPRSTRASRPTTSPTSPSCSTSASRWPCSSPRPSRPRLSRDSGAAAGEGADGEGDGGEQAEVVEVLEQQRESRRRRGMVAAHGGDDVDGDAARGRRRRPVRRGGCAGSRRRTAPPARPHQAHAASTNSPASTTQATAATTLRRNPSDVPARPASANGRRRRPAGRPARSVIARTTATNAAARLTAIAALSGRWAVQPTHTVSGAVLRRDPPAVEAAGDELGRPERSGGRRRLPRRVVALADDQPAPVRAVLDRDRAVEPIAVDHRRRRTVRAIGRHAAACVGASRARCGRPAGRCAGSCCPVTATVPDASVTGVDARRRVERCTVERRGHRPGHPDGHGVAVDGDEVVAAAGVERPRHRAGDDVADLGDRGRQHHGVAEAAVARGSLGRSTSISIVSGPASNPSGTSIDDTPSASGRPTSTSTAGRPASAARR